MCTSLGADEFAVHLDRTLDDGEEVAQRVVDALALPYRTGEYTFAIGASVGVATLGAAGGQFVFRQADAALRAAKAAGKGCVRVADGAAVMSSGAALADLETLTAEGNLRLRLDPAVDQGGRISVLHALPVFEHPERGPVMGQELWAGAERYGVSTRMQTWLLGEACAAAVRLGDVSVAVSLPAGHVSAENLADEIAATLERTGLAPSRLMLSFTEETLLTASAALVPELEAARATGVRLCLDNFGMGHSLYAVLARIPLDLVRVDVTALAVRDDLDRALQVLAAIAHSATAFGIDVIAGGIGSADAFRAAGDAGVALLHGRHLPHDLTVETAAALLAAEAVPTP
jgi:predicted signal transduction protein with EAL and GGDEF domain